MTAENKNWQNEFLCNRKVLVASEKLQRDTFLLIGKERRGCKNGKFN